MRATLIRILVVLLIVCAAFGAWWFGPWRTKMTLADGVTSDGTRFRVVQSYKDFCTSGWYIGVYVADTRGRWRLRWSEGAKLPWKRATVVSTSEGLVVTALTGTESYRVTGEQMSEDVPDELGWTFPSGTSLDDMQSGLIEITY